MSRLFNRAVQVTVGGRTDIGLRFRGLRTIFRVEKSLESNPNNAQIQLYNLSADSRSEFEAKGAVIKLEAGYGHWERSQNDVKEEFRGELKLLFIGDIALVRTERQGPDLITTIEAGDGEARYQTAKLDASFKEGTTASQVFDALVASFGLSKGSIFGLNLADQFSNGLSLSGLARDHMDMLARRQGFEWSIQDDQLQLLTPRGTTGQQVVLLNKNTGLIGSPFKTVVVNQSVLTKKDAKEADKGVRFTSLLNAEIRPGRRLRIESEAVTGEFRVNKVIHSGDTHGNIFFSEGEAS